MDDNQSGNILFGAFAAGAGSSQFIDYVGQPQFTKKKRLFMGHQR